MRNVVAYLKSWFGRFEAVHYPRLDPYLWVPAGGLLVLGVLMVLNTTYFLGLERAGDAFHFFELHLCHIAAGLAVMLVLSHFSLVGLRRLAKPLALFSTLLLIAVYVPHLGVVRGGARRWLRAGPLLVEPSELAKLAAVFFLADLVARRQERIERPGAVALPAALSVGALALLVLKQPDFGNAVMLVLLLFTMLFAGGARPVHLGAGAAAALVLLGGQAVVKPYRMKRLSTFLDPWRTARGAGFQLIQSFIALGAGGGWGVGLGAGRQKMFYLPQAHTDFVFAVVGEELGVAGALLVFALFGALLMRGMRIAHQEPDPFASLLAVGLTALLSLQALINMAVVIGMLPTKGLPLPFLSYGGTAIVTAMAALGVLLALARRPTVR